MTAQLHALDGGKTGRVIFDQQMDVDEVTLADRGTSATFNGAYDADKRRAFAMFANVLDDTFMPRYKGRVRVVVEALDD